jgi:hypothetical protein
MEELEKAKERNEVKLAILEANIVKEPMKCKPTRAKLGKYLNTRRLKVMPMSFKTYVHKLLLYP